jgi:hypothetical protein
MSKHKSYYYKLTAVKYFLENNDTNYTKHVIYLSVQKEV